jgi:hypothetical protein
MKLGMSIEFHPATPPQYFYITLTAIVAVYIERSWSKFHNIFLICVS